MHTYTHTHANISAQSITHLFVDGRVLSVNCFVLVVKQEFG